MFTNSLKAEEKENNPWNFHSLYDLLYFNCPSCAYKNNSKQEFVNHAYDRHPKSFSELFSAPGVRLLCLNRFDLISSLKACKIQGE